MSAAPWLIGGTGNDTYFVSNSADVVTEAVGQGFDTVYVSTDFTLPAGSEVEVIQLRPSLAPGLTLAGNEFANVVIGGIGNDTLIGLGGSDVFVASPTTAVPTITDFAADDLIEYLSIGFSSKTMIGHSGDATRGTLTVSDGTHTSQIALLGNYMASSFVTASDDHGGTLLGLDAATVSASQHTLAPAA